ncbi:MAG TPA: DUF5996 family protein [Gaiellaceae bacterium]|nr:DUF5996 family protein [Gaiellaceae bacterium]
MSWEPLPYEAWKETRDTLHMQLQVVGKVRLALSPFEPQWANVPLYLTGRGLTTSTIPHPSGEIFDVVLDLIDHTAVVRTGMGHVEPVSLETMPVAAFYAEMMDALERAGVPVEISTLPSEVDNPIRFPDDTVHATYDREAVTRFWHVLLEVEAVLREFRASYRGKSPPVELWWGTLDLAMALYTGKDVEVPQDAGVIHRLGGDAEAFCAGFWPGDERTPHPAFFAYRYPAPVGLDQGRWWNAELGEFVRPYDDVRESPDPRAALREFVDYTFALTGGEP